MNDYLQPTFYRFNEDSLKLVSFVNSIIKDVDSILDLGAGSGVIGIELSNRLVPKELTLLEAQEDYLPFLETNCQALLRIETKSKIILSSFGEWIPDRKYDLVVCNPPYFLPGHGQKSSDPRKQLARTFEKDSWDILIKLVRDCVSEKGRAFFVIRTDEQLLKHLSAYHFFQTALEHVTILELPRLNV